jgi:hypothetical protein
VNICVQDNFWVYLADFFVSGTCPKCGYEVRLCGLAVLILSSLQAAFNIYHLSNV